MSQKDRGEPAADMAGAGLDAAWQDFEDALGGYLATMVDPDEGDHLIVEMPGGDGAGSAPYAQFAGFDGGGMLRAELSGNTYLLPKYRLSDDECGMLAGWGWVGNDEDGDPDEANWWRHVPVTAVGEVACGVVRVLRDVFGVAHPQLLTFQAWGPAADGADRLGLTATADVPVEAADQEFGLPFPAYAPTGPDQLRQRAEQALAEKFDGGVVTDEDGDLVVMHAGGPVWLQARGDQPALLVFTRVVHDVRSRTQTSVELDLLNRDNLWVRWVRRDRAVWMQMAIPALPFVPSQLDALLDVFLRAIDETRDDLAARLRAKVG